MYIVAVWKMYTVVSILYPAHYSSCGTPYFTYELSYNIWIHWWVQITLSVHR